MLKEYIKVREEKFGAVVFDTQKEKVFVVNKTARDILRLIKENKNTQQIIEELSKRYKGDKEKITQDVKRFIEKLVGMGIL